MSTNTRVLPKWDDPLRYLELPKNTFFRAVTELQHEINIGTHVFWDERGLLSVNLPITTGAISSPMGLGSDSKPVQIDLFGVPTFLADSMQFALEYACRLHEEGAFYIMPSFRGEDTDDTHLAQFTHSEAEFPGGLDHCMDQVDDYVRMLVGRVLQRHEATLTAVAGDLSHLENVLRGPAIARVSFDEAEERLAKVPGAIVAEDGWRDLTRAGEREICRQFGGAVWVTRWDAKAVPFYQAVDDRGRAQNADLLLNGVEVVGCGERHQTAVQVTDALRQHKTAAQPYEWYLQMKEHYPMHTSGFGMGVERFLCWLTRHEDVRDVQIFTRRNGADLVP